MFVLTNHFDLSEGKISIGNLGSTHAAFSLHTRTHLSYSIDYSGDKLKTLVNLSSPSAPQLNYLSRVKEAVQIASHKSWAAVS